MATAASASPASVNAAVLQALLTSPQIRRKRVALPPQNVAAGATATFLPTKTGYIRGFFVNVKATVESSATATALQMGYAKLLGAVQYVDFSGSTRHSTTGLELTAIMAQRQHGFLGLNGGGDYANAGAIALNNAVVNFPSSLAATTPENVEVWYYVPMVETITGNLYGLEFAQYQQAQAQLSLTLNSGALGDALTGMYSTAVTISNAKISVIQDYYDGALPSQNGQIVLPPLSTGMAYRINSQLFPLTLSASQQTLHALDQSWTYLSYMFLYDNGGTFGVASSAAGTPDLSAVGLYINSQTPVFNDPPSLIAMHNAARMPQREWIPGLYFIDVADRPINASVNGQYSFAVTPATVNAGAFARYTVETLQPSNG
jgi:hypothetical protein